MSNNLSGSISVNGLMVSGMSNSTGSTLGSTCTVIVPSGSSYLIAGSMGINSWSELR